MSNSSSKVMRPIVKTLGALICLAALACQSGCIAWYTKAPVDLLVLDAETNEPIAGAKVGVHYAYMLMLNVPKDPHALSDHDGRAVLSVARSRSFANVWEVTAPGFTRYTELHGDGPERTSAAKNARASNERRVVRLYREPDPTLTVVVPNGYRGPLLVDLRPVPGFIQDSIGQRTFTIEATDLGYASLDAKLLLQRYTHIDVQYADGTPLSDSCGINQDDEVRLRRGFTGFHQELFYVGTKAEMQPWFKQAADHIAQVLPGGTQAEIAQRLRDMLYIDRDAPAAQAARETNAQRQ